MVIKGGKSLRGQVKETGLNPRMSIKGSDKETLQSGAKRRSICKNSPEGEALGRHHGLRRHVMRLLVRPGD